MRRLHLILAALLFAGGVGCRRSAPEAAQENQPAKSEPLFSYHFIGTKRLGASTNAGKLKRIWALPETKALREEIVRKLAAAPKQLFKLRLSSPEEDRSALLRPLLDDLIESESFLLLRGASNEPSDWTLAMRLDDARADLWQTNLWQLMIVWAVGSPAAYTADGHSGWQLKKHETPNLLRLVRAGEWLVLGLGNDQLPEQQALLEGINKAGTPSPASENWLEAEANCAWLAQSLDWSDWAKGPFAQWPKAKLAIHGKEDKLRTSLRLFYAQPIKWRHQTWEIPTNIMPNTDRSPLISFTAFQGIASWLDQSKAIKDLELEPTPNQLYVWAQSDVAFETYAATPIQNGTNSLQRLAASLPPFLNTNFHRFGTGKIHWESNRTELVGKGLPIVVPFLRTGGEPGKEFLTAGLFPVPPGSNPPPAELVAQIAGRTNLIYYDWEITQARLNQWITLSQFFGYILPDLAGGMRPPLLQGQINIPGLNWLQAVGRELTNTVGRTDAAGTQEDNTVTEATITGPQELTVLRNSHLGFTGFELVDLARWLNDPAFPLFGRDGAMGTNQPSAKPASKP